MDEAPLEELGGLSPRDYASGEGFRTMFRMGLTGRLLTTPAGFLPGSEVAILSILGYAPDELPRGRAALEAAGAGVIFPSGNVAFRCNFVRSGADGRIDPSVSLSSRSRRILLRALSPLGIEHGRGDVGLLSQSPEEAMYMGCSPYGWTPGAPGSALPEVVREAARILHRHPLGALSPDGPDSIWIWSGSVVRSFRQFPYQATLIAAVPLVRGIGYATGMNVVDVPGATGNCLTDYSAKTRAAISALSGSDIVIIHIEACDEASHRRSLPDKLRAISAIDHDVIRPLLKEAARREDLTLAVISDHPTSSLSGLHGAGPVEFAILPPRTVSPASLPSRLLSGSQFIRLCLHPIQ